MKLDIRHEGLKMDRDLTAFIQQKAAGLEKRLKRYHPEMAHLTVKINQVAQKNIYVCKLDLNVLRDYISVKKEASTPSLAFQDAFRALRKEFEKYRLKINKNLRSRQMLHRQRSAAAEVQVSDWENYFQTVVSHKLKDLLRLARHELLNYQLSGQLEPGELLPEDIVDEAVLRVFTRATPGETPKDLMRSLTRTVLQVAREFAGTISRERAQTISVDKRTGLLPPQEAVTTLGEEILYFYQPDEVLKVEDVMEDPSALTPEEILQDEEIINLLYYHLNELPEAQRKAYVLVAIEGFSPEETAMVLDAAPEKVMEWVQQARQTLGQKLARDRAALPEKRVDEIFWTLKSLPVEVVTEQRLKAIQERIVFQGS